MRKLYTLLGLFLVLIGVSLHAYAADGQVRVLLIGSHGRGPTHWITQQSFRIENLLHFNGIPYDFFDIGTGSLDSWVVASYEGVIAEGNAMRWDATEQERAILANFMETGSVSVLLTVVNGLFSQLNGTLYAALDVSVDGVANSEAHIQLLPGATNIYDYAGDYGFIVVGGTGAKHVALTMTSLANCMTANWAYGGEPCYAVELALETWLEKAFGADARVTMPTISLRLDDTQTMGSPRDTTVTNFMNANNDRIRASGYIVTDVSAYSYSDSLRQHDEQVISQWGSMSLHGMDHNPVGAEGENQDYAQQYSETNQAVSFLQQHFPRYKAIKACPDNSWNVATLHALANNGIYYHTANLFYSPAYQALYKSLFDVSSDMDRERMFARQQCQLRYYPLLHTDETGEARIYSVDGYVCLDGTIPPADVVPDLRRQTLDWWTPMLVCAHFVCPTGCGSDIHPQGWIDAMNALMESVDDTNRPWRRWVDNYDYARNLSLFDQRFTVGDISVEGDVITYELAADQPIKFLTLRAGRPGQKVLSVKVNGADYPYFGDDYVHLPEISGDAEVQVRLTGFDDVGPHVTHISPNAVIENARLNGDRIHLELSGEFTFQASVAGSSRAFSNSTTTVFSDRTEQVQADASSQSAIDQIGLSLTPSSGSITVSVGAWDPGPCNRRSWREDHHAGGRGVQSAGELEQVDVVVEDLVPGSRYMVGIQGCAVDSCYSDETGKISFTHPVSGDTLELEVWRPDSTGSAGVSGDPAGPEARDALALASHPNPFSRATDISYELAQPSRVSLGIYSVDGLLVVSLVDRYEEAGAHSVEWNGCDGRGNSVSPGLYFCRIRTLAGTRTHKIALFR